LPRKNRIPDNTELQLQKETEQITEMKIMNIVEEGSDICDTENDHIQNNSGDTEKDCTSALIQCLKITIWEMIM
jgi:hypothetical protein